MRDLFEALGILTYFLFVFIHGGLVLLGVEYRIEYGFGVIVPFFFYFAAETVELYFPDTRGVCDCDRS